MTSSKAMACDVYGYAHKTDLPLVRDVKIGRDNTMICIPQIGVVYEIDTNGLDIRRPWITDILQGHYNNGYDGDEWITDYIPKQNYKIIRFHIGSDLLHDEIKIYVGDNVDEMQQQVIKVVEERRKRLLQFAEYLRNNPEKCKFLSNYSLDMVIYRKLFAIGGLMDKTEYDVNDFNDLIDLLESKIFYDDKTIDLFKYQYLEKIRKEIMQMKPLDFITYVKECLEKYKANTINNLEKAQLANNSSLMQKSVNILNFCDQMMNYVNNEVVHESKKVQ